MTSQPGRTLLLKIPLEIRYNIYSLLISTPSAVSVNLHAKSQHTWSKKISIKRGQRILKSLSEICNVKKKGWSGPTTLFLVLQLSTDLKLSRDLQFSRDLQLPKDLQLSRESLILCSVFPERDFHKHMDGNQIAANIFRCTTKLGGEARSAKESSWDTRDVIRSWYFKERSGRQLDDYDRWSNTLNP
jgi:hypothetical protein